MKIHTPEISWHNREPVFSVDIQKRIEFDEDQIRYYRIVTCGSDNFVAIWRAYLNTQQQSAITIQSDSLKTANVSDHRMSTTIRDRLEEDVNLVLNEMLDQSASAFDDQQQTTTDSPSSKLIDPISDHNEMPPAQKKPSDKKLINLDCVCTLNLHVKAVNVAKFAPTSNLLATGSDDQYIYIWEHKNNSDTSDTDKDRCNPFSEFDDQLIVKENWKRVNTLRRHINDVVDLAWSPDEKFLITGSVDNMSYVWDVKKGDVLFELPKHLGYVQGVAWDPLNSLIATLCTDRNLRIFNAPTSERSKKSSLISKINKIKLNSNDEKAKNSSLFWDDTLATISRRMSFSPNGELLACPSGIMELDENEEDGSNKFVNCLHMFCRNNEFKKLHCYFPTGVYTNSVQFCPKLFKLNPDLPNPYPFPYRMVFAIAAKDRILIYDTQQAYPIAKISDIHYTRLSDLAWSIDGQLLLASSTDGYCTFVYFTANELGDHYEGESYKYETCEAKKQSNASSTNGNAENKKTKRSTIDETVPKENLSTERTPQPKISNFFKKTPTPSPLLPTKLANSFEKMANKSSAPNVIDLETEIDCKVINEQSINNTTQQSSKEPVVKSTPCIKTLLSKQTTSSKVNLIQNLVKRKPTFKNEISLLNSTNQDSQSIENKPNDQENCKSNQQNEGCQIQLPLKRASEQAVNDQEAKKKKIDSESTAKRKVPFITIPN